MVIITSCNVHFKKVWAFKEVLLKGHKLPFLGTVAFGAAVHRNV